MSAPYAVTIIAHDASAELGSVLSIPGVKTVLHQVCPDYETFVLYQKALAAGIFGAADSLVAEKSKGPK